MALATFEAPEPPSVNLPLAECFFKQAVDAFTKNEKQKFEAARAMVLLNLGLTLERK